MPKRPTINADKPHRWKDDVARSVDQFNEWFVAFAPVTFQKERQAAAAVVASALDQLDNLHSLTPDRLAKDPSVLITLRMATAPPIARDRLIGLSGVPGGLVRSMERGALPPRMVAARLQAPLAALCTLIDKLLDRELFPWLADKRAPTDQERARAEVIVADRLTGATSDPIIRNAQEARQLALIGKLLDERGYTRKAPPSGQALTDMEPGTFAFRMNVIVGDAVKVNIPIDVAVQPHKPRPNQLPILIEAKSAGDFTNTNKRRKEEATKIAQLRATYGPDAQLILFLCGYFDAGYLGYEAAEGLDWVWEHRMEDLLELGI
jgi:hypothetical protein